MALKYFNNVTGPLSSSSTEDSPSLMQSQPVPIFNPIPTIGKRGIKRTHTSSDDSTDEDSWIPSHRNQRDLDPSQKAGARNALETAPNPSARRLLKRRRLVSPGDVFTSISVQPVEVNEYSDGEDDNQSDVPPSVASRSAKLWVSRTMNCDSFGFRESSTSQNKLINDPSPSEYTNVNGLLRALRLSREWQTSRRQQDHLAGTNEKSEKGPSHIDRKESLPSPSVAPQTQRIEIGDDEKNRVTQIYEETNRYV